MGRTSDKPETDVTCSTELEETGRSAIAAFGLIPKLANRQRLMIESDRESVVIRKPGETVEQGMKLRAFPYLS